jgi:hypothetical protein
MQKMGARAAVSLARLYRHEKKTQARQMLSNAFARFKESLETPGLRAAKELLDDIGRWGKNSKARIWKLRSSPSRIEVLAIGVRNAETMRVANPNRLERHCDSGGGIYRRHPTKTSILRRTRTYEAPSTQFATDVSFRDWRTDRGRRADIDTYGRATG